MEYTLLLIDTRFSGSGGIVPELSDLYRLQRRDIANATATLVDAFSDDPLFNALFGGNKNQSRLFQAAYEAPIKYCLKYGSVYSISEKLEGVAAWVSGEYAAMPLWRMLFSGALRSGMKVGLKIGKRIMPILMPLEEDRKRNMAGRQHIYLQVVGVAREFQGRGIGGTLLRALIVESERAGRPIYLETETESNVGMYEKLGFELVKKVMLPVVDLPAWEMIRTADNGSG